MKPSTLIRPQPTADVNGSDGDGAARLDARHAGDPVAEPADRTRLRRRDWETGGRWRPRRIEITFSGLKPGETFCRRTKLRIRRPAPISSISENATSDTTSRLRRRRLRACRSRHRPVCCGRQP